MAPLTTDAETPSSSCWHQSPGGAHKPGLTPVRPTSTYACLAIFWHRVLRRLHREIVKKTFNKEIGQTVVIAFRTWSKSVLTGHFLHASSSFYTPLCLSQNA